VVEEWGRGDAVQILEVTGYAIRSAAITLRRADTPLTFVLYPMLHFAAPSFYAEVRRRLRSCDLIVSEGVAGPTLQSSAMDLTNRLFPRGRQRGLVGQTDEMVLPPGIPVIRPDLPLIDLDRQLRSLPTLTQLAFLAGTHPTAVALALAGPAIFLDDDLAVHDFPFTASEERARDTPLAHAALDHRDRLLLADLCEVHEQRSAEPITVGVVYGAGHMPAVVNGLTDRYRYRVRDAEWMTVFIPD
jgi:hypothetical protein